MKDHPLFTDHPELIAVFGIAVVIMLLLDLGVFNRNSHVVSNKEALCWSLAWVSLAMVFSGMIYYYTGSTKFYEFQSAYWIEKALSVDNLFVFILVFKFFDVANESKHKVLFWGIIGALILRAIFIFLGAFLIELTYLNKLLSLVGIEGFDYDINIIMTLFGLFLVYAGIKSWSSGDDDKNENFNSTRGAKLIRKLFKVGDKYDGSKFFTIENEKKVATPLLIVVAVIEFTDLLFAVDSIPAIFAISSDPFILYISNIFAILGLRALFFLLDNFIHLFSRLKYGLAIILFFIGIKMVISPFYHVESVFSLLIIAGVLILSVIISVVFPEVEKAK